MVAPVKDMKWMILGGEGQLGRAISKELAISGVEFISLNRVQLDITNLIDIKEWFKKESPDVVVNSAAWTNVDSAESEEKEALLVNAFGPKYLAEQCAENGVRFIQISTDYVFSGDATSPWGEFEETEPTSAYGRTKAQGERFVLDVYPSGSLVVRTAWLYSPWGKNFVKTVLKIALKENRNIEVVGDQVGQPTSAIDLSKQIHELVNSGVTHGIYHGTNSGQATWFELAQLLFSVVGQDPYRVKEVNSSAFPRPAKRPQYSVLGHKLWKSTGVRPMRNWQDALNDVLPEILQSIEREG
jgi:dTDP-4-dehydrorhamnose reductase